MMDIISEVDFDKKDRKKVDVYGRNGYVWCGGFYVAATYDIEPQAPRIRIHAKSSRGGLTGSFIEIPYDGGYIEKLINALKEAKEKIDNEVTK